MMNKLAAALLAFTAGCAAENDGTLHLTGRLADPSQVTHVIATNAETGERIVIDMKSDGEIDGAFDVAVPAGGAWIVTFADLTKVGADMRIATLQAGGLDAFKSKTGGTLDFGTVNISGTYAHGSLTWDAVESATGERRATLEQLAKIDNLALRYSNPDVDGDGKLDALQGRNYRIELDGRYAMQTRGRDLSITDLVTGYDAAGIRYMGTSLHTAVPRAMGMNMQSGTVTFEQPFYGTALGMSTPMVQPGTRIGQPHIKFGELDGDPRVGVVAHPGRNAPSGSYVFDFDNGKLTFTGVNAPSATMLTAAADYSVPFVRIRTANETCIAGCDIKAVDLAWQRATESGWQAVAPRDARLDVVAQLNERSVYLSADLVDGATSINWTALPLGTSGLRRSELAYISTGEICYLAVTYTSELGMKMTSQIENPGCF